MKRLNTRTLEAFLHDDRPAVLLVGDTEGRATMAQAVEFALLWAECGAAVRFAYIDAAESPAAAHQLRIRSLPTTLVLQDGLERVRFEGVHARASIEDAFFDAAVEHAVAA